MKPEAYAIHEVLALGTSLDRVRQQIADEFLKEEYLQLIETIIFYKLPSMSREEIAAMFGMSELKQTRVYQEALEEGRQEGELIGKLKAVLPMLAMGASVQQIAEALSLSVDQVRQAAQNQQRE